MSNLIGKVQNAVAWRSRRLMQEAGKLSTNYKLWKINRRVDNAELDARISYPCYKSLDGYIDVEKLKDLDSCLTERIKDFLAQNNGAEFNSGPYKLDRKSPEKPGSKLIELSVSKDGFSYFNLDKSSSWELSPDADKFPELIDFIKTLPFKETARMIVMCDTEGRAVTAHRDHADINVRHEFIWFRSNFGKPFYLYNPKTKEKAYIESYAAWFDTVNQYHGADNADGMTFSIRVDGIFSDDFRKNIPMPESNPASTAALWACVSS